VSVPAVEPADGVELVPVPVVAPPTTLFRSAEPNEIVTHAAETAHALAAVIRKQKLSVSIQGRSYVKVEGWTLLGSLLGVFPVLIWSRPLENGWEARVEARTRDGAVVGAAEAMTLRSERSWASRDDYALRSMAQTRATSKALRQPLGFIVEMAGYSATPAEEMPPHPEAGPVEAAAPSSPSAPPPTGGEILASENQARNVFRLVNKLDKTGILDKQVLMDAIGREYGTERPAELTRVQATDLIKRLKVKAGEVE